MFSWLDLLGVLEDKYSLSLRPTLWLSDVGPVLLSSTEGLEITIATERERRVSKTGAVATQLMLIVPVRSALLLIMRSCNHRLNIPY